MCKYFLKKALLIDKGFQLSGKKMGSFVEMLRGNTTFNRLTRQKSKVFRYSDMQFSSSSVVQLIRSLVARLFSVSGQQVAQKVVKKSLFITTLFTLTLFTQSCKDDMQVGGGDGGTTTTKPNVLLIIADDLGKDACVGYSQGIQKPVMPTISSLVSDGIRFENFWVNPLCTPTRSSILTGKYPLRNDMLTVNNVLASTEKSLHTYLSEQATDQVASAIIGKWHLGRSVNHPTNLGVPHYSGLISGALQDYNRWTWTHDGMTETSTEYSTTKFTDLAIDWIAQQQGQWFMWLAYNAPHTPFHLPPSSLHTQDQLVDDSATIAGNPLPYYLAMIEAMDTEIGRLLNSLDEQTLANTYIIFIGDNGTPSGVAQSPYGRVKAKNSMYLGGVNTPCIIKGPGLGSGEVNEGFIQSTDLFTSIAEIFGANGQDYNDSRSFMADGGGISSDRKFLYSEIGGEDRVAGHTIRNDSFHLIKYDNGNTLLFNVFNDLEQDVDLSASSNAAVLQNKSELEAELANIRP